MKKLINLVLVLVLLVVVAVVAVFFFIDRIAKTGIEKAATYALNVNTTLGSADVKVLSGEFAMADLNVANPEGFKSNHFMTLGEGGVAVSLASLREDTVELPTLTLSDIDVNLEKNEGKSNYKIILESLGRFESGEDAAETQDGKRFIIRTVTVKNVVVHIDALGFGGDATKLDIKVDEILLKDVGSDGDRGVLLADLAGVLVKAIVAAVIEKGGDLIPAAMLGELQQSLASLTSIADIANIKGLGEGVVKSLGNIGGTVGDITKGLGDVAGDPAKVIGDVTGEAGKAIGDVTKDIGGGLGGLLGGDKKKEDAKNEKP